VVSAKANLSTRKVSLTKIYNSEANYNCRRTYMLECATYSDTEHVIRVRQYCFPHGNVLST